LKAQIRKGYLPGKRRITINGEATELHSEKGKGLCGTG
jgi:hypothetical protein